MEVARGETATVPVAVLVAGAGAAAAAVVARPDAADARPLGATASAPGRLGAASLATGVAQVAWAEEGTEGVGGVQGVPRLGGPVAGEEAAAVATPRGGDALRPAPVVVPSGGGARRAEAAPVPAPVGAAPPPGTEPLNVSELGCLRGMPVPLVAAPPAESRADAANDVQADAVVRPDRRGPHVERAVHPDA